MSQGVIILIVMVVFFVGMAVFAWKFAYIKEKREARRRLKRIKAIQARDDQIKEKHKGVRELIDEKYKLADERSRQIKQELRQLEEWKSRNQGHFQ